MRVDGELIAYLEELSCLTLSGEEKRRMTDDLEKILGYMSLLSGIDTEGVPERSHPFDKCNAFREDAVKTSPERVLVLKNAPETMRGMFAAPKVIE